MSRASSLSLTTPELVAVAPGRPHAFRRWCTAFLGWTPHPKQEAFGQSMARMLMLVCGIRFGKSDCLAPKYLHHMFYRPNGRYLNVSFSEDQAKIVVSRAVEMALSGPMRGFVEKVVKSPHLTLTLKNGATLQARSLDDANLLRGKTYDGIGDDEAFGPREEFDVLPGRVIDRDGWIAITTTPPPIKNWVFEQWLRCETEQMQGNPRYFAETGSTYDNPHLSREAIEAWRAQYTELGAEREIDGKFVDNEGATFPRQLVDDAHAAFKTYEIEPKPMPRGSYISAFDLARKKAMFAGITVETSLRKHIVEVGWRRGSGVPWIEQGRQIEMDRAAWDSSVIIDGTGVGDVTSGFLNIAHDSFMFNAKSRAQGIILMQKVFQERAIALDPRHHELSTQLMLHTWKEDAADVTFDDFDALLMALWKANQMNATLGFSVIS